MRNSALVGCPSKYNNTPLFFLVRNLTCILETNGSRLLKKSSLSFHSRKLFFLKLMTVVSEIVQ